MAAKTCESYVIEKLVKAETEIEELKIENDNLLKQLEQANKVLDVIKEVATAKYLHANEDAYIKFDYVWYDNPNVNLVIDILGLDIQEED